MSKIWKLTVAFVVTSVVTVSTGYGQCQSGYNSSPGDQSCCGGGPFGLFSGIHSDGDWKKQFQLVMDRNQAWPQPFNCQDRHAYAAVWRMHYDSGIMSAHTLTAEYFNQFNQLNHAGQARVAWIMQNAPQGQKRIYIYDENEATDVRMAHVQETVDLWYSQMGSATIAKTTSKPNTVSSIYQQTTNQLYLENQPEPIIPVDVGSSIAGSTTE